MTGKEIVDTYCRRVSTIMVVDYPVKLADAIDAALAQGKREEREACAKVAFGKVFSSDLVGNHELADIAAASIRSRMTP